MKSLSLPQGYQWDHELRLGEETTALTNLLWPNYIVSESDIPEPDLVFEIDQQEFIRRFPLWGIRRADTKQLVAYANAVQLWVDPSLDELPQEGWRFAIQSFGQKVQPNCLCLLVANIHPSARGLGLGKTLIQRAKQAALELGLKTMIAPVRPTQKQDFPQLSMTDYVTKRTENGEVFDPWIKMHTSCGGKVLNICSESVLVRASINRWREWTGLPLLKSGQHVLPQALAPLNIDLDKKIGVYCEPNIWLRYTLGE